MTIIDKLNRSLDIARQIPFYQNRIKIKKIYDENDLEQIPFTDKEDLRQLKPLAMITVNRENLYAYHESFGTTGVPIATWFTQNDFQAYVDQLAESPVNINRNDIVIIRFPYAISVPAHIFTELIKQKGGCVVPVSRATPISPFPRVLQLIEKLKATILCCNPQEAFILEAVARNLGYKINEHFNSLRAICSAGEMLAPARKKRLEELWGIPVYDFYGTTETGNLAVSCPEGNLHCSDKHFYFEIINYKQNRRVNDGEKGILHITTLSKENFPLLRYNVGDIVQILPSTCPCGNPAPILIHHGRLIDCLTVADQTVTLREVQEAFLSLPQSIISNFWEINEKKEQIEICYESDSSLPDHKIPNLEIPLPYRFIPVAPGSLMDINRLCKIEPFGKPKYIKRESENIVEH